MIRRRRFGRMRLFVPMLAAASIRVPPILSVTETPMAAQILDGKALAKKMRDELKQEFAKLNELGYEAHLVSLSIGSDEGSDWYVNNQKKQAEKLGVKYTAERIDASSSFEEAAYKIREICNRDDVTAMILQLPVPDHLDGNELAKVIAPEKNVEGVGQPRPPVDEAIPQRALHRRGRH